MNTPGGKGQPGSWRDRQRPAAGPAQVTRKDRAVGWGEVGAGRATCSLGLGQWAQGHIGVEVTGGSEAHSGENCAPQGGAAVV